MRDREIVERRGLPAVVEQRRLPSPGPEPLGLAFDGATLWVASREAHRLYALDRATWVVREEVATPGAPFGIAVGGDAMRVVIGHGEDDDDRYLYRFVPGRGFDDERVACPDLSGVHVAIDGDVLYLSQAHNRKILTLDDGGDVVREFRLERRPVGMAVVEGTVMLITVDDDFENSEMTKLQVRGGVPHATSLATIPFAARGLAYDGTHWWTAHRATNEIVTFVLPD